MTGLIPSVRDREYPITLATGSSGEDVILDDDSSKDSKIKTYTTRKTIAEISEVNYAIVQKALCKYPVYKFNTLKSYFPNLNSTREFIASADYLGNIKIAVTSKYENPPLSVINTACSNILGKIASVISGIEETYEGTKEFSTKHLNEVFKDKKINVELKTAGSIGYSQNDSTVPSAWKIDLSNEDWFAFEDNFGTSEEQAFVAYFKTYVDTLKGKYDKIYLVRNERQLAIYSFDGGERFEPDYVLFLHRNKADGYEQLQVFIEPKGTGFIKKDIWKENFLLELEANAIPIIKFVDDNDYKIWGFHFFNAGDKENLDNINVEFINDMALI